MDLKQQVELTFTRIEEILNKLKNLSTATVTVIEENDVTNITTKLDTVKASTDLLLTDITSMKTELESLENEISSIDTAIDNNSTDITAILSATATLKTDIENITTNLSELAKDCSNYYSIVGSDAMQARDNSEANRQKLNDIAIDLNNIGFDITDIANGTGTLLGENEEIKSNLSTLLTNIELLQADTNILNANIDTIKEDLSSLKTNIGTIISDITTIKTNTINIKTDTTQIKANTTEILENLEELSSSLGNSGGNNDEAINEISSDISDINVKLNNLLYYMQENTEQLPFETDIYALDQEFTGYDNTIVYSTSDSLECNFPYSINESSNNSYRYLEYLAIYCEDSTYSLTFEGVLKSIQTDCCLNVVFPNTTYGDGIENTYEVKLNPGMNNLSFTIENIKMTSTYNYVQFLFTNTSVKMQNYKIEVFGKNIKILNKPYKYKIFSQDDCTIISKVENNKAFEKTLKTSNLNPVQLTTPYELIKENVRDFFSYRSVFSTSGISSPIFFTKIWTDLSGALWIKNLDLAPYRCTIFNFSSICRACDTIGDKYTGITYSLSLSYGRIVLVKAITDFKSYSSNIYLTSSLETIGNFALVYDCHNLCKEIKYIFITTLTDCNNYLYLDFKSTFPALNLGFGQNVTAYFDKNSQNIIYVYMKVGNYMVKKTVEISTVTNDDGTESQNMTITNVKVIGTYDFYFETNTDVYFIVKDGTLKMFKKNTD